MPAPTAPLPFTSTEPATAPEGGVRTRLTNTGAGGKNEQSNASVAFVGPAALRPPIAYNVVPSETMMSSPRGVGRNVPDRHPRAGWNSSTASEKPEGPKKEPNPPAATTQPLHVALPKSERAVGIPGADAQESVIGS